MKKILLMLLCLPQFLFAQSSNTSAITINGYAEAYYAYNNLPVFNTANSNANYIYNHQLTNQFAINLALLQVKYATKKTRANLALHTGTYPVANYAAEPTLLQTINEANVGVLLSNKKNIWLDVGVMPSHIGAESAIGKDNPTLTRSLLADNSPYFETGAKATYISNNEQLTAAVLLLNGWQNIVASIPNNPMAYGAQFTYTPATNFKINYSNFFGKVFYNAAIFNRQYHDFFAEYSFAKKYKAAACLDIGIDKTNTYKQSWYGWYTYLQHKINSQHALTARLEKFNDRNPIFLRSGNLRTINPTIISINYDYAINKNILFRLEPKYTLINETLNQPNTVYTTSNFLFTSSLCVNF
jgi:hypothetical protein